MSRAWKVWTCIIGRYLETILFLSLCPCPYPGFQPFRPPEASTLGLGKAFGSQLHCKCKVGLPYVQDATRIPLRSGMRHWGRGQDYYQGLGPNVVDEESVVDSKTRASRERKWKVDIAVDIIRCTKNRGGLCRPGVYWLPGANEFELTLRYFYLCLDLPHAGSVARMPRRRQAL